MRVNWFVILFLTSGACYADLSFTKSLSSDKIERLEKVTEPPDGDREALLDPVASVKFPLIPYPFESNPLECHIGHRVQPSQGETIGGQNSDVSVSIATLLHSRGIIASAGPPKPFASAERSPSQFVGRPQVRYVGVSKLYGVFVPTTAGRSYLGQYPGASSECVVLRIPEEAGQSSHVYLGRSSSMF